MSKRLKPARLRFAPVLLDGRRLGVYTAGGHWTPAPYGLPSSLTVLGESWRVVFHTRLYSARAKASRLLGCVNHVERVVVVDPGQPPAELRSTLRHEAAHALLHLGRQADPVIAKMPSELEERLCGLLERALGSLVWA